MNGTSWRRCRDLGLLCIGALVVSSVPAGAAVHARGSSLPSSSSLVTKAKAAMLKRTSVHFSISVVDEKSKVAEAIVADVGKTTGEEDFSTGSALAHLRVTGNAAYLGGNTSGLEDFFGMPSSDAGKVGSKWIVVSKGSSQYTSLLQSVTLSPLASSLFPTNEKVKVSAKTDHGVSVYLLTWTDKSSGTVTDQSLELTARGTPLPFAASGTAKASTGTVVQDIAFGKWNEALTIGKPSPTIPFSSVS